MNSSSDSTQRAGRMIGIVGGASRLSCADLLHKLHGANADARGSQRIDIALERRSLVVLPRGATALKLHVFDAIRDLEQRGTRIVALPCFDSHVFIDELQANTTAVIVDMIAALFAHVRERYPFARRVGVLTSPELHIQGLFERYGAKTGIDVLSAGVTGGADALREACGQLVARGVDVVLPGSAHSALSLRRYASVGMPVIDSHAVYAQHLLTAAHGSPQRLAKLGVVGGVGPAATVDFLHKVVRNTPARRDQDHIKVIVEQNPQIPDRTEHLTGNGVDPTLALYATCRKLEDGGADLIAIPCNTAHAFIAPIETRLHVPIVNMMRVTVDHLRATFPGLTRVGVLATDGTIASGVYRTALEARGMTQIVPPLAMQARVMNAIYGSRGIKAGFTSGECADDIISAVESLLAQDVDVILLACTELPLLFPDATTVTRAGRTAHLVDPTEVLAKFCIEFVLGKPLANASVEYAATHVHPANCPALHAGIV